MSASPDGGDQEHRGDGDTGASTAGRQYARRLQRLSEKRWKRILDVQRPYRWNIQRLPLGRTLDIGCGLGRNLAYLDGGSVGVDHNAESVAIARIRGLDAYTVDSFLASRHARPGTFDTLLFAHVLEHMTEDAALDLMTAYLPLLAPTGRMCLITPQEAGYRSDATHVRFVDFDGFRRLSDAFEFRITRQFSFPLPRATGRIFRYNEFVAVAERP